MKTKANFHIREGKESDFESVFSLIKELALFEKSPESVTNSLALIKAEKDYFKFSVAEQDGKIVGIAIYFFAYYTWVGKSLYLDDLYVQEPCRGLGIGEKLLDEIFRIAKAENCKRIRWQVLDWNQDAIRFYEKRGAVVSKEWLNCDVLL